jgi:hypothetical protein
VYFFNLEFRTWYGKKNILPELTCRVQFHLHFVMNITFIYKYQAMKGYCTITNHGTKWRWSDSRSHLLYPQGKSSGTDWIGDWDVLTASLDAAKRQIAVPPVIKHRLPSNAKSLRCQLCVYDSEVITVTMIQSHLVPECVLYQAATNLLPYSFISALFLNLLFSTFFAVVLLPPCLSTT